MINPINGIKFTKQEQVNLLKTLSLVSHMADEMARDPAIVAFTYPEHIERLEYIAKAAYSMFCTLDRKFYVDSTPRKEENHE